jgi:hypothetical protein
LKIRSVIEHHIDKKGKSNFNSSKLVVTERKSQYSPEEKERKLKVAKTLCTPNKNQLSEPLFNINSSNKILLEPKKQEIIKMFSQNIKIQDSDDEEPDFI